MKPSNIWYVYIVKCSDNSLYTGITTDIQRRVKEHNNSTEGAKYTRSRRPVKLVYQENCENRSSASKREIEIKKLQTDKKRNLINKTK